MYLNPAVGDGPTGMVRWAQAALWLHAAAALVLTAGVHLRCDADLWLVRLRVDAYDAPNGSAALWVEAPDDRLAACWADPGRADCRRDGLPLYERAPGGWGFHLFAVLAHFEWLSAAFALYYERNARAWRPWWLPALVALVGTAVCCAPGRAAPTAMEAVLFAGGGLLACAVFWVYHGLTLEDAAAASEREPIWASVSWASRLEEDAAAQVHLGAMRYLEYSLTAPELFLGVLAVFVKDPPVFMAVGGHAMILLCNLYGATLHYALVGKPVQAQPPAAGARPKAARAMRPPPAWLGDEAPGAADALAEAVRTRAWGSYIASNTSTLGNSWLAFALGMGLILYQQTFLTSGDPPAFVVFTGWSLLLSYSSFGVWATAVYLFPDALTAALAGPLAARNAWELLNRGLDALSVIAKLSVVGSLAGGFVFMADGRC